MRMFVSLRNDAGDAVLEAFLDQTYAWLDAMQADFQRCMGTEFGGHGVLFAHDVLVELHGRDASWARFDVHALERWIAENVPELSIAVPSFLCDVMCFTNYLARHGHIEPAIAIETERRAFEVIGLERRPSAPPSRRERRRAARAKRRLH